jgi:hypothetical protein
MYHESVDSFFEISCEVSMASCQTCGRQISSFTTEKECKYCFETRIAKEDRDERERAKFRSLDESEQKRITEEAERVRSEREMQVKQTWMEEQVDVFCAALAPHKPLFLYQRVFRPVDSNVDKALLAPSFTLDKVEELGAQGWQLVGIVPRTVGVALTNVSIGSVSGNSWGAGMGGNIDGVYMVMQLTVTVENIDSLRSTIGEHFWSNRKR